MTTPGTVLTFFSYKGGAGRTMLLANVAVLLAEWGYDVLCVDFDLDAPGLGRYLGPDVSARVRGAPGLLEWFERGGRDGPGAEPPIPVRVAVGLRSLAVLSAGVEDDRYFQRLDRVDWKDLEQKEFSRAMEAARNAWVGRYDFVLVDARAGSTLIGAIATSLLADDVVLVVPPNEQAIEGSAAAAERIVRAREVAGYRSGTVRFVPVQSRADAIAEGELAVRWLRRHAERFGPCFEEWTEAAPEALVEQLRVPHASRWSFGEHLPVTDETGNGPTTVSWAYHNVAALLAHRLEAAERLLTDRSAYLREARKEQTVTSGAPAGWAAELDGLAARAGGEAAYGTWRAERGLSPLDVRSVFPWGLPAFDWLRGVPGVEAERVAELQAWWERSQVTSSPPDPEVGFAAHPRPAPADLGLCLIVDIFGYATAGRASQQAMMRFLLTELMALPILQGARRGRDFHIQSAGDGLLLVVNKRIAVDSPLALVRGAFRLLDASSKFHQLYGEQLRCRAGMNRVSWSPGLAGLGDLNLMEGSGFGTSQLVAELSPAGQVVATEEFVDELKPFLEPGIEVVPAPPVGTEPWALPIRTGKEVRLRRLGRAGMQVDESAVPPVIAVQREARERLRFELYSQLMFAAGSLRPLSSGAPSPLWRVRLWYMAAEDEEVLVPSNFGVDQQYNPLPPTNTRWSADGAASNPVGVAFRSGQPQFIRALPEVNSRAYFGRWRKLGVDAAQVGTFTRRPRALLCAPYGLIDTRSGTRGVICLDSDQPIEPSAREIRDTLNEICEMSGPYVAALWTLIVGEGRP